MKPHPACDLTLAFLRVLQRGPSQCKGRGPSWRQRSLCPQKPAQDGGERFCRAAATAQIPPLSVCGAENNGASVFLRQTPGGPLEAQRSGPSDEPTPPHPKRSSSVNLWRLSRQGGGGRVRRYTHLNPHPNNERRKQLHPIKLLTPQFQTPPGVFPESPPGFGNMMLQNLTAKVPPPTPFMAAASWKSAAQAVRGQRLLGKNN